MIQEHIASHTSKKNLYQEKYEGKNVRYLDRINSCGSYRSRMNIMSIALQGGEFIQNQKSVIYIYIIYSHAKLLGYQVLIIPCMYVLL